MINLLIFLIVGIIIMLLNYKLDTTGKLRYGAAVMVLGIVLFTLMMMEEFSK